MLTPSLNPGAASNGDWKYLTDENNNCLGCGKKIYCHNKNIEYSRTKRGTHIFWHTECTGKVWH